MVEERSQAAPAEGERRESARETGAHHRDSRDRLGRDEEQRQTQGETSEPVGDEVDAVPREPEGPAGEAADEIRQAVADDPYDEQCH